MLANGKEANYLMINGDVFESSNAWPKFYKFKNNSQPLTMYKLQIDNNNVTLVNDMVSGQRHIYFGLNWDKVIVYKTLNYNGEEYALVDCSISIYDSNQNATGGWQLSAVLNTAAWFKMSDLGGGTLIVENGGVNSPSYLLFIYDIREVAPYVS